MGKTAQMGESVQANRPGSQGSVHAVMNFFWESVSGDPLYADLRQCCQSSFRRARANSPGYPCRESQQPTMTPVRPTPPQQCKRQDPSGHRDICSAPLSGLAYRILRILTSTSGTFFIRSVSFCGSVSP